MIAMPTRLSRTGGFTGIERKFFDTEHSNQSLSLTWAAAEPATTNLTAVAQGDSESNRDGRKYVIDSIHLRGFFLTTAKESETTPVCDILVRMILVQDTQTNGAQLTATDVMDAGQTDDINSFRNLQFTKRFIVLHDRQYLLRRNNTNEGAVNLFAAAATRNPSWKINKRFPGGIPVTMSGTTADIANVTDNSIHMIMVADDTSARVSYQCRIRFRG